MIHFPPHIKVTNCKNESHRIHLKDKHGMVPVTITVPIPAHRKGKK